VNPCGETRPVQGRQWPVEAASRIRPAAAQDIRDVGDPVKTALLVNTCQDSYCSSQETDSTLDQDARRLAYDCCVLCPIGGPQAPRAQDPPVSRQGDHPPGALPRPRADQHLRPLTSQRLLCKSVCAQVPDAEGCLLWRGVGPASPGTGPSLLNSTARPAQHCSRSFARHKSAMCRHLEGTLHIGRAAMKKMPKN
jgi:hypothetical protein